MFAGINLTDDRKLKMKEIGQSFAKALSRCVNSPRQASGVASGERGRYVQRSVGYPEAAEPAGAGETNGRTV